MLSLKLGRVSLPEPLSSKTMALLARKKRRKITGPTLPSYCLPQSTSLSSQYPSILHVRHIIQNMLILPQNTKSPPMSKNHLKSHQGKKQDKSNNNCYHWSLPHIISCRTETASTIPMTQPIQPSLVLLSQRPPLPPCLLGSYGHL